MSAATTVPSTNLAASTELSARPDFVTFVNAMFLSLYTIYNTY
jgi:hypothetical protein